MSSVDVIVPCYRYGRFLRECVESVLAQKGVDVRVFIIDDASPDNTADVGTELSKESSKVTFVRHEANKGHIATYNEGIAWASADFFLLLSADDYLLPGALSRAVLLMGKHSDVSFVFGNAIEVDEQATRHTTDAIPCRDGDRILAGTEFIVLSGARNIVPTPTAVVRTGSQKAVGGYRAELPHAGDMEMWLRLAAHASVGFVETPQAVYRRHASNMSLRYTAQHWLPDLEQRKVAFDYFLQIYGNAAPDAQQLRRTLLSLLAREAVGHASAAFNDGERDASDQLAAFASRISPEITWSLPWVKLAAKRVMGLSIWRALQRAQGSPVRIGSGAH